MRRVQSFLEPSKARQGHLAPPLPLLLVLTNILSSQAFRLHSLKEPNPPLQIPVYWEVTSCNIYQRYQLLQKYPNLSSVLVMEAKITPKVC
jgi:hypothetical protein